MLRFTKMHGIGNDYVYINTFDQTVENPSELSRIMSCRHFGIGSDGLILIGPSDIADASMRIFNADGSEAEMCGNGLRCVAKYVFDHQIAESRGPFTIPGNQEHFDASLIIETGNGVLSVGLAVDTNQTAQSICVNMGRPSTRPNDIPVLVQGEIVLNYPMKIERQLLHMTCVSMGNPHAVFFIENINEFDLEHYGPLIERHALFPKRTNAHFVQIVNKNEIIIRTWERGSGVTLACGTGACACIVAAVLNNLTERHCIAHLPGGQLTLYWNPDSEHVYMTGPAVEVFSGMWLL